jgi:hypothetical protein
MCMSDLRHIHDPVLSSLKMEGILLLYCFLTASMSVSVILVTQCAFNTIL